MQTINNKASYPITGLDRHLGLQEADAPKISLQLAYEVRRAVSSTHLRFYPPPPKKEIPWNSFLLEAESESTPGT
jgi:hypothetical protein